MERHTNDLTTDEEIDAALDMARQLRDEPRIVDAIYRAEPGLDFLMLRLSDGRRLLIPREDLPELKGATMDQVIDLIVGPNGTDVWWPQIDDGLYLPNFLQYRWHDRTEAVAA